MNLIDLNISQIYSLCKKHKVDKLFAFGSVLTNNFNQESDIDLIVDFKDVELNEYADNYFGLKFSLENIFNRPVDLLEDKAIRNPYFKSTIEAKRKLIYGK